ncbi:MAG: c-type cytochrome [Mariniblastus sp.]|nr:c-type cytochrome [Mariniblastus sp.]
MKSANKELTLLLSSMRILVIGLALSPSLLVGQSEKTPVPNKPIIEAASNEGQEAIAQFKYPQNLKCELFSAEPNVANIVAFHRDYRGDVYVCETFRQGKGVEDNRKHAHWMDEELAAQTVQDRIDYIRKYIPDADQSYTANDDRIRLLRDTDGNGTPDSVSVFSDRYNKLEMGTGAGVLSYRGKVFYTCIPDLFQLEDKDNDGVADVRKSLHTGFGVRFAFRGHDMHGLIVGPDGRIYFSIGDRGYNISKTIKDPASGAVFRCELDGSHLEVVATGLRNPQELAFDEYGNLFTGDNNSDSGDKARWVEVVQGSDSGWRMYYQYQPDRGPFNREKIWHPYNAQTPAYIVPPITNISDGPSGLEFYPGTGFGEDFDGRFFLCDFRGDASRSGVRSFKNEPVGAFWKLVEDEQPFWNMLVTDIDFGSDGKLYASDWVFGWEGENKGRLYTFFDPAQVDSPLVKQVENLLKSGLKDQTAENLKSLMGHLDQRVRQEAQFELVERTDIATLKSVAIDTQEDPLARVHAIWGIGQLGRAGSLAEDAAGILGSLFQDSDWHVVAAAAATLGEVELKSSRSLAALLSHKNLRVRFRAALALANHGDSGDVPAIAKMLIENADKDPMVRHGGIMALNGIFTRKESNAVADLAKHESRSVRIAVCVAMRKLLESKQTGIYRHRSTATKLLGGWLEDEDEQIVLEAARIIHDLEVKPQMSSLAALLNRVDDFAEDDALLRRVISANVRVGAKANAEALVQFAINDKYNEDRRLDAVNALSSWANPPERMMVLHAWRPLDPNKRNVLDARNAIESNFTALISGTDKVTGAAITAAGNLGLNSIGDGLAQVVLSDDAVELTRVAALASLQTLKYPGINDVLENLVANYDSLSEKLAAQTIRTVAAESEERGIGLIEKALKNGQQYTKQAAIDTLGQMKGTASGTLLNSLLQKMIRGEVADELRLDVTMAAGNREEEELKKSLSLYEAKTTSPDNKMSAYVDTLAGGDYEAGAKIFFGKTEVSCVRCHQVDGTGGEVGPELSGVAIKRNRKYLLESIVDPNKEIAEGFAQIKVQTDEGELHTGIVKRETDEFLVLLDADGKEILIEQDAIEGKKQGQSSMPDDLIKQLTKKEVRDLVEYLSGRKTPQPDKKIEHE